MTVEPLERRVLLSDITAAVPRRIPDALAETNQSSPASLNAGVRVANTVTQTALQDLPAFPIDTWPGTTIPTGELPADFTQTMNGLRFYSEKKWNSAPTGGTFGTADDPGWTLIGFDGPSFTPMLLSYGVTTLNSGLNLNNSIAWSNGLYTVSTGSGGTVVGGLTIQTVGGAMYTDSLLNTGTLYDISTVHSSTVTLNAPASLTSGQTIEFSGLTDNIGLLAGPVYAVDQVISPTQFTFKAKDNSDVSGASASSGKVTTIASGTDTENWGAAILFPTQLNLMGPQSVGNAPAKIGFTPTRILLTKTTDAVSKPQLRFSGLQSFEYNDSKFNVGIGYSSPNDNKYLNIDASGLYQLIDGDDLDKTKIELNFTLGDTAISSVNQVTRLQGGTFTTATDLNMSDNDVIHFVSLNMDVPTDGSAPALQIGVPYGLQEVDDTTFRLIDLTTGQLITDRGATANSASFIKEQRVVTIQNGVVTVVDAKVPFVIGEAITFANVPAAGSGIYYVTSITDDTFTFSDTVGGANATFNADGGTMRVTTPLHTHGALTIGGQANLLMSIQGGYQSGEWTVPKDGDFYLQLSGELSAAFTPAKGMSGSLMLELGGDSETSAGLVIQSIGGKIKPSDWGFNINGVISKPGANPGDPAAFNIAVSGLTASAIYDADEKEVLSVSGSAVIAVPKWTSTVVSVFFGKGETNGLTLVREAGGDSYVSEAYAEFSIDRVPPTAAQSNVFGGVKLYSFDGQFSYTRTETDNSDTWELGVGGAVVLAIGRDNAPDENGNWKTSISTISLQASPDSLKFGSNGFDIAVGTITLAVNGSFQPGPLKMVAEDLQISYTKPENGGDGTIAITGGLMLPQLHNAAVEFGEGGSGSGLFIDTVTHDWKLDGVRIAIPQLGTGVFTVKNLILGFNVTDSGDWDVELGGQMGLFEGGGLVVGVHLKMGEEDDHFIVQDIGASLRNLNPGLPIPGLEGFLTDIGFEIDNIPTNISADILFGAAFGDQVKVGAKEYAAIQALVNGEYSASDIKITGTVLFAGGTLGTFNGTLDLNWGIQTYTVDMTGSFLYDSVEGHIYLYFSDDLDAGLFSAKLQVPPSIPIIGGIEVAEGDVEYYVSHDGGDQFVAAWAKFFGHWNYGFKYDFKDQSFKLIGASTIKGLEGELPSNVVNPPHAYNYTYTDQSPSEEAVAGGLYEDDESTDTYGLLHVTWDNPATDKSDVISVSTDGKNVTKVFGPGVSTTDWIDDGNGFSYMLVPDYSDQGNVMVHVIATAAFSGTDDNGVPYSRTNPNLYQPLPKGTINVVLVSSNVQNIDYDTDWTGAFSGPAPEIRNVSLSQPTLPSALGGLVGDGPATNDPVSYDNAHADFQWRGLDPESTTVDLYYDYDQSGYNGTRFATLKAADLNLSGHNPGDWISVDVPWDLTGLEPSVPIYAYAVIRDANHVSTKSDYVGKVQSVPAASIQVSYVGDTEVTTAELEGIPLAVTPVSSVSLELIESDGAIVMSPNPAYAPKIGDVLMLSGLDGPSGIQTGTPYYVVGLDPTRNAFFVSGSSTGSAITNASFDGGKAYFETGPAVYYATGKNGVVSPHVEVNQQYRFSMAPTRGVFLPQPATDGSQELSWTKDLIQYNTFVGNDQLLRMNFQFSVQAAVAGTVYLDDSANGQLDSQDDGAAGVTVYLDDNNNNVLDVGEQYQVTGKDGSYLLVHAFLSTDLPTTTYAANIKIIPPAGWQTTQSPDLPAGGVVFTNDGNNQAALNYYDFLVATPITASGVVYDDANGNGARDPGEKGLANVQVTVTPPSGPAQVLTTDAYGAWKATSHARGQYSISVALPGGASYTTPTTTTIDSGNMGDVILTPGYEGYQMQNTKFLTSYDAGLGGYRQWITSMPIDPNNVYSHFDFNDITDPDDEDVVPLNFKYIDDAAASHPSQRFMGKWQSDGVPTPAASYYNSDVFYNGNFFTYLLVSPSTQVKGSNNDLPIAASAAPNEFFALSYDPSQPNYSTVASIDANNKAWIWSYDPTKLGNASSTPAFTKGAQLFSIDPSLQVVDVIGVNLSGSDPFQARDMAVLVEDPTTSQYSVIIWNHLTGQTVKNDVGGDRLVNMVTGDFDGNGRQDVALLTADILSSKYYINTLLSEADGSIDVLPFGGGNLSIMEGTADWQIDTALAAVRVNGEQDALVWTTASVAFNEPYLNAAVVTGDQFRVSSARLDINGVPVPITAGSLGSAAQLWIWSTDSRDDNDLEFQWVDLTINADGNLSVNPDLVKNGGPVGGFDIGVKFANPPASTATGTSGIVFNDTNSNGYQDEGEPGLGGQTVRLISTDGSIQVATTSDGTDGQAIGTYFFANPQAGSHLQVTLQPNTWLALDPPQGVPTNAGTNTALSVSVGFVRGTPIAGVTLDFPQSNANTGVTMAAANLQNLKQENLIIRTANSLFVQVFNLNGGSKFVRYDVGSSAGYFKPELELADINGDGKPDIVTAGQNGVDVFINKGVAAFTPYLNVMSNLANQTGYGDVRQFAGDIDSTISTVKTYTHLIDFGNTDNITVNGQTFTGASKPAGDNYQLVSVNPTTKETVDPVLFTGFGNNVQGNLNSAVSNFYYSSTGVEQLTLSGLTPGQLYTTTFYGAGYAAGQRTQTITDSLGGSVVLDENAFGSGNGILFTRTFMATSDSIVYTFTGTNLGASFHQYALTNEVAYPGDTGPGFATRVAIVPASGTQAARILAAQQNTGTVFEIGWNGTAPAPTGKSYTTGKIISDLEFGNIGVEDGYTAPVPISDDFSTGISSSFQYTHTLNFGATANLNVNGVNFIPAGTSSSGGQQWSLNSYNPADGSLGNMSLITGFSNNLTGHMNTALTDFLYAPQGAEQLTLSGLTPGTTYQTTFYGAGYGAAGGRGQVITDSLGGTTTLDENAYGNGQGMTFSRTFTATSTSITFTFINQTPNASFHQYALTNRVVKTTPGQNDLIVFEAKDRFSAPLFGPDESNIQRLWRLDEETGYLTGNTIYDTMAGMSIYWPRVGLDIAPLFSGAESVVLYGNVVTGTPNGGVLSTYRGLNGLISTNFAQSENDNYSIAIGNFIPGVASPSVIVMNGPNLLVFGGQANPDNPRDPTGFDPNLPLVNYGTTGSVMSSDVVTAVGIPTTSHADDLMVIADTGTGYQLVPFANTAGSYTLLDSANGSLYDFGVVVPGSNGGVIEGQVFYDVNKTGQWAQEDYGVYNGLTVYIDENKNGSLDATEPRTTPTLDGRYSFNQLNPGTYRVALLAADGYNLSTAAYEDVTLQALPNTTQRGVDFGIWSKDVGSDLNNDGYSDFVLTDPATGKVYAQLRDGLIRYDTHLLGELPGPTWMVAGIVDLSSNGSADILIHDKATGELRVWELGTGRGIPAVVKKYKLDYLVPAGFSVFSAGDLDGNGKPELVIANKSTGQQQAIEFNGRTAGDTRSFDLPDNTDLVAVGDFDFDGDADLLLRDRTSKHLFAQTLESGTQDKLADLGLPEADLAVAGIGDFIKGDFAEVLFQDRSTGQAFAWSLDSDLNVTDKFPIDIGTHNGLRLQLAEEDDGTDAGNTVTGTISHDNTGDGKSEDDTPFSGVEVKLYLDRNRNGFYEKSDGPAIDSTVSAADGSYRFAVPAAGKYLVSETVPDGYVRTGSPRFGAYAITLDEATESAGNDFSNYKVDSFDVVDVHYQITHAGVTKVVNTLHNNVTAGDTVRAIFTVPQNTSATMSLVSYRAPDGAFAEGRLNEQLLFQVDTGTFTAGVHTLQVTVPDEDFQIDFVKGYPITTFGKIGTNITYTAQHRLVSAGYGED
ncbi:MAG: SdrD B-like domain-containing protein [Tepidisphaeraceae bacterium]